MSMWRSDISCTSLAVVLTTALALPVSVCAQRQIEQDSTWRALDSIYVRPVDTSTAIPVDVADEDPEKYSRHPYWQIEFGPSLPMGGTRTFASPIGKQEFSASRPFRDFYRFGYTVAGQFGVVTDEGYDLGASLRYTKVNYTNYGVAYIRLADAGNTISAADGLTSYLFETQIYLGRRLQLFDPLQDAIYVAMAAGLGSLESYSNAGSLSDRQTGTISAVGGYEIPIRYDSENHRSLAFRVQLEWIALASGDRPRFANVTFALRTYAR